MPAGSGTPRDEKPELWFGTANWHGGFCHAPPLRGTSLRATLTTVVVPGVSVDVLPRGYGAWIPVYTGMTNLGSGGGFRGTSRRTAFIPSQPLWIPAFAGMTRSGSGPAGLLVAAGHVDDLLLFYREVDGVDDLQELQRVGGGYGDLPNAVERLLDEVIDEREPVGAAV